MLSSPLPPNCPIIAYHKVSEKKEAGLTTVSPSVFEKQISWLANAGYRSISFNDLYTAEPLPEKPVIITFDDGYDCIHRYAVPVLSVYGFTAVVYIITGFIGKYSTWEAVKWQQKYKHLTAGQIRELHALGFEIGSHGQTHRFLPALPGEEIRKEATESRKFLEDLTGGRIFSFCYPYGRYTSRVKKVIAECGYTYGIQNLRLFKKTQDDRLALMRHSIYLSDSFNLFKKKVRRPLRFSPRLLQESLIQKGALAGIVINWLKRYSK